MTELGQVFRFLDLPAEIRNEVYKILLCTWTTVWPYVDSVTLANKSGILRTNKQIYREGFDYMVKHNRFIRIDRKGSGRTSLVPRIYQYFRTPTTILDISPQVARQFKGYVAQVSLDVFGADTTEPDADRNQQWEYLMLSRDLSDLLKWLYVAVMHLSEAAHPSMTITFNNVCTQWPMHRECKGITATSPENARIIQSDIIRQLSLLRGYSRLQITGAMDESLANQVVQEASSPTTQESDDRVTETLRPAKIRKCRSIPPRPFGRR